MKIIYLREKLFNSNIIVCQGDFQKIKKNLKKKYNIKLYDKDKVEDTKGFTTYRNHTYIIYLNKYNVNVLVHELLHLAFFILHDREVFLGETAEILAYYQQYLFKHFRKKLK